ncbi:anti-sigma factor family protein [Effusibacillus lacus]|uniref:Anti-sigma-W factor RsiW n=1 Tax=Effusibacillus lacus TaxID=1348429 RepID=A0A292YDW4_9BACL|nr:zf-HC2 domain-containing protein [Effusibacillus lacus]TCS68764.1 putative zinc finger protein [Effusibacillus lacus]GAX90682.1 hypothetical protein EFBL_2320 [Effusibacillus lacus]
MTNWHVEERLSAYLANEVEPEERDFIESHLEICTACRQEFEFLKELDLMLDDMPLEDPGSDFADAVMARIQSEATRKIGFWRGTDFRNMAASIVAAFLLFQGFIGVAPKISEVDSTISMYTATAEMQLKLWVQDISQLLGKRR